MKSRDDLERAIRKSATGKDETDFLLASLDKTIAEEIESQDKAYNSEITELKIKVVQLDLLLTTAKQELENLKTAFNRES